MASQSCNQDGTCLQGHDMLWLVIREYSPYKMHIQAFNNGHFVVGGICGIGTFVNHRIIYNMREGFGGQNQVAAGEADNLCENGRFSVPIDSFVAGRPIVPDRRYILELELVGITENGSEVSNPSPVNYGSLDVIFTSTNEN